VPLTKQLTIDPWVRLPLKLLIVRESLCDDMKSKGFPQIPEHMNVQVGELASLETYRKGSVLDEDSISSIEENDGDTSLEMSNTSISLEVGGGEECTASGENIHCCSVCGDRVVEKSQYALCVACNSLYHIKCLSEWFMNGDTISLLPPSKGTCPCCLMDIFWSDIASCAR
jgi:hypothetical protein